MERLEELDMRALVAVSMMYGVEASEMTCWSGNEISNDKASSASSAMLTTTKREAGRPGGRLRTAPFERSATSQSRAGNCSQP